MNKNSQVLCAICYDATSDFQKAAFNIRSLCGESGHFATQNSSHTDKRYTKNRSSRTPKIPHPFPLTMKTSDLVEGIHYYRIEKMAKMAQTAKDESESVAPPKHKCTFTPNCIKKVLQKKDGVPQVSGDACETVIHFMELLTKDILQKCVQKSESSGSKIITVDVLKEAIENDARLHFISKCIDKNNTNGACGTASSKKGK
eukprot:310309_1